MSPWDVKKVEKALYAPTDQPTMVEVPKMLFLMVDGEGNPNTSPSYAKAVEALYSVSYTIKMQKKTDTVPPGYFEYVVPPLEGLWSIADPEYVGGPIEDKEKFQWTMMIRQPEFVTAEVLSQAKAILAKKKPQVDTTKVRLAVYEEGLSAQVMHLGPFDTEGETIEELARFIAESGYREDMTKTRRHHEIYLSDPRKTDPKKWRTVLRHPVAPRDQG